MEESYFYKEMKIIKREKEMSIRQFSKICGLSYAMMIEFFNPEKPFRPLREDTMAKINHNLGISYKVMEDYNEQVLKLRGE